MDISIGIEDKGMQLSPLILNRTHDALRCGCLVLLNEVEGTDGRIVRLTLTDSENDVNKEKSVLCTILADIIVENLQIRHLVKLLKQEYYFLSEKEQCDILIKTLKKLWYGTREQKNQAVLCKREIKSRVKEVLSQNGSDTFMLEGFMRFRMKDYLECWEIELCRCVEDYIKKREYIEFVEILRLFIKIRIPRVRKVHICVDGDGEYVLFDEKLCLLRCQQANSIDKDDALLSALVNIAPLSIIVHNKERFFDARIIETLKDVFGNRVVFSEDMI